jgi:hypothetical protein
LYSLNELRAGTLVENDFPALADTLAASGSMLGVVDLTDRSRIFFHRLGIRLLSSIAGTGSPVFGDMVVRPLWFKQHHNDVLRATLRRPIFAQALHAVALLQRHAFPAFSPVDHNELATRLHSIGGVAFYSQILREYSVGTATIRVPIEAAIGDSVIGLVAPRTKLDFQQLISHALAEAAGAANAAQARALSTAFLPFVLCRTSEEIVVCMERTGVDIRRRERFEEPELEFETAEAEELGEDIIRQVFYSLSTSREPEASAEDSVDHSAAQVTSSGPPSPTLQSLPLPPIESVKLSIRQPSERTLETGSSRSGWSGGSNGWAPRTIAEMERDREVGRRGEELVYRMEVERVRQAGHPDPESAVIWTSRNDPGADHDIRSIDGNGGVRWIEVKSTTGNDGRFDWPRKEFEKAMRERERYELWRVYRAASMAAIAKCFRDPAKMLGESRLQLELGSLRACVENIE